MTDLDAITNDVLNEMYSEAEPPADFDDIQANPEEYPDDWYSRHYLDEQRQRDIADKHCTKHGLSAKERMSVYWTTVLDYGPTAVPIDDAN